MKPAGPSCTSSWSKKASKDIGKALGGLDNLFLMRAQKVKIFWLMFCKYLFSALQIFEEHHEH